MVSIDIKELQVKEQFEFGGFSTVHKAYYNNVLYCFKKFTSEYPSYILENLKELTEMNFSDEFVVPKVLVTHNNEILGYLSDLKENTGDITDFCDIELQKILLKKSKLVLQKLHHDYKRIHGDLNLSNFIYSFYTLKPYLIDFDSSLKFGSEVKCLTSFPESLLDYLKYYQLDYLADIYEFNLLTLSVIEKKWPWQILDEMNDGVYNFDDKPKEVRRLCRELSLEDTTKKISGEFIIDYL